MIVQPVKEYVPNGERKHTREAAIEKQHHSTHLHPVVRVPLPRAPVLLLVAPLRRDVEEVAAVVHLCRDGDVDYNCFSSSGPQS